MPANLPPGSYHYLVGMYDLSTMQRVPLADGSGDAAVLGDLIVPPPLPAGLDLNRAARAVFGDAIALQDLRIGTNGIHRGDKIDLTLYWRSLAPVAAEHKVFVHVFDDTGSIVAQEDQEPLAGHLPTSKWQSGDVVADPYMLSVPSTARSRTYQVAIGLYDAKTSARLPIAGLSDSQLVVAEFMLDSSGNP